MQVFGSFATEKKGTPSCLIHNYASLLQRLGKTHGIGVFLLDTVLWSFRGSRYRHCVLFKCSRRFCVRYCSCKFRQMSSSIILWMLWSLSRRSRDLFWHVRVKYMVLVVPKIGASGQGQVSTKPLKSSSFNEG